MARDLPQPISITDEYLAAVHDLLGEIRDRLPAPKAKPTSGPTKVAEPAATPHRRAPRRDVKG